MSPAPASPFISLGNDQIRALRKLADIFSATAPAETPKLRDPAPAPRVLPRFQIRAPPMVLPMPQSTRTQTTAKHPRVPTPQVRVLPRIQIRAPPRVQTTPQPARIQTTTQVPAVPTPLAPPPTLIPGISRPPPHPIDLYPTQGAPPSAHGNQPHLIESDNFEPNMHRYPLRSLSQQADAVQSIDRLLGESACNSVVDAATGDTLEYRHLLRTPYKALWTRALATDLGKLAQGVSTRVKGKIRLGTSPTQLFQKAERLRMPVLSPHSGHAKRLNTESESQLAETS